MPDAGCSAWQREVGADDEPGRRPHPQESRRPIGAV